MVGKRVIFVVLLAMVISCILSGCSDKVDKELVERQKDKFEVLEKTVLADEEFTKQYEELTKQGVPFVCFLSLCDTMQRAMVVHASGPDLKSAMVSVEKLAEEYVGEHNYDVSWLKLDLVVSTEKKTREEVETETKAGQNEQYRYCMAFDDKFECAFLEQEINGNKLIDYDEHVLDLETINKYLETFEREKVKKLPEDITLFTCQGWFLDENDNAYKLNSSLNGALLDSGRRIVETVDKDVALSVVDTSSAFLCRQLLDDGQFIYGYYPTYDKALTSYNILRHAGTIWSMVCQYRLTGDEELTEKITQAFDYMLNGFMQLRGEDTAYIVERKSTEIKLGGNAVAIVAMTDYMDEMETDCYKDICVKLGNGILSMMDQETGTYTHVISPEDYSVIEEMRTVYYDGEATFALARLYALTNDQKWLDAACAAVDHFIEADYTQYRDHWVAYSLNEVTKYVPDVDYLTFALKNANDNLKRIYNQKTTYHTYLELLMATFEVYDRIIENGYEVPYLEEFDTEYFLETILKRADYMLNGYCYPEMAMYLKNPSRIVGAFCVRHDGYRVRIDDVQHNVGGYYKYYQHYDEIMEYLSKE